MKKLIILLTMLNTTSLFASESFNNCGTGYGTISLKINDDIAIGSTTRTPEISYTIKLKDAIYPMVDIIALHLEWCIDAKCDSFVATRTIIPSGLNESINSQRFSMPTIYKGNHIYTYRIWIPRYLCDVRATANITIN